MVTNRRKLSAPFSIFPLLLAALLSSTSAVYAAAATSTGGTYTILEPPGSTDTTVAGINNDGQVVGYFSALTGGYGFLFSGGAYTLLDPPHSADPQPVGLNDSGQVVGYFVDVNTGKTHGFMLSAGVYSTLDPPNSTYTVPFCINDSDQIVGYYDDARSIPHGFLYSGGDYTTIDPPNSSGSFPRFINDSGQIVGSFYDAEMRSHAFLYSSGSYTVVDPPNSEGAFPAAIDTGGDVAGTFDDDQGLHGFLFDGSSYTVLELKNALFSQPYGINDYGQVAGDAFVAGTSAFVYSSGAFTLLNPPNSTVSSARGINDSGQVAGTYYDSTGRHGFIYNPLVSDTFQFPAGVSMVSVPYDYSNQGIDAAVLFGLSGSAAPAPIAIYDPVKNAYDFYPTLLDGGKQTRPGRAYWVLETAAHPPLAAGDPVASPFTESLSPGWNMIADPFPVVLGISTLQFTAAVSEGTNGAAASISEPDAVTAGLIGAPLWTYDMNSNQYQQTTTLQPYSGCWIYIDPVVSGGHPVTLTFTQPGM